MSSRHPTTVIVNGANWVGSKLVELLLDQKGNVVVIDDFTPLNMPFVKRYSSSKHFVFIEKDKIDSVRTSFSHIKYFIHLKHDFDTEDDRISSKSFVRETKFVDDLLTIALEKNSTYILTSSIHLHKDFLFKKHYTRDENAYNESDLQDYVEKTVQEYVDKAGLNGRIVRLGNVYGPDMDLEKDPLLHQIILDALTSDEIRVYGDGLEFMYYVYITDAVQGILKALFYPDTQGKVYAITHPDEISVLSIVNKILAQEPRARRIKFLKGKGAVDPLYQKAYIPDENLSDIGWKPHVAFDRGMARLFASIRQEASSLHSDSYAHPDTQENIRKTIPQHDEEVQVGFDETVNLTNTFFGSGNQDDHLEFKDFYKKFSNTKKVKKAVAVQPHKSKPQKVAITLAAKRQEQYRPKQSTPVRAAKAALFIALFAVLYIFFIVPVFRVGLLLWDINQESKNVSQVLSESGNGSISPPGLGPRAEKDLVGIGWAVNLFNLDDLESNIIDVAYGIDSAATAHAQIQEKRLEPYVSGSVSVSEEDITNIQSILIMLDESQQQLDAIEKISLPYGGNQYVRSIRSWSYNTEDNLRLNTE